jgi:hypothetical protein
MDRFHVFTDGELHEMRHALEDEWVVNKRSQRPNDDVDRLLDEIKHLQVQRSHREHRERLPG